MLKFSLKHNTHLLYGKQTSPPFLYPVCLIGTSPPENVTFYHFAPLDIYFISIQECNATLFWGYFLMFSFLFFTGRTYERLLTDIFLRKNAIFSNYCEGMRIFGAFFVGKMGPLRAVRIFPTKKEARRLLLAGGVYRIKSLYIGRTISGLSYITISPSCIHIS